MQIHELNALSRAPQTGDVLAIDTGTDTAKIDYNALATAIINKLGGDPVTIAHGGSGATTADGACENIGAVKKSGDAMTGGLIIDASASSEPRYSLHGANGRIWTLYRDDNTNLVFAQWGDGTSLRMPLWMEWATGKVRMASPLDVSQGGTGATTWNGARENLGIIARQEYVPFDVNGWGTLNTPDGFTPFAAALDQNWFITVHPPNKILARSMVDYNNLIRSDSVTINILYAKLA